MYHLILSQLPFQIKKWINSEHKYSPCNSMQLIPPTYKDLETPWMELDAVHTDHENGYRPTYKNLIFSEKKY